MKKLWWVTPWIPTCRISNYGKPKGNCFFSSKSSKHWLAFGSTLHPVTVTRIYALLVGNLEKNLHLPRLHPGGVDPNDRLNSWGEDWFAAWPFDQSHRRWNTSKIARLLGTGIGKHTLGLCYIGHQGGGALCEKKMSKIDIDMKIWWCWGETYLHAY